MAKVGLTEWAIAANSIMQVVSEMDEVPENVKRALKVTLDGAPTELNIAGGIAALAVMAQFKNKA